MDGVARSPLRDLYGRLERIRAGIEHATERVRFHEREADRYRKQLDTARLNLRALLRQIKREETKNG
jgi:dsDNA-binding SOS-regulon protein